jgi:hypothetical protein
MQHATVLFCSLVLALGCGSSAEFGSGQAGSEAASKVAADQGGEAGDRAAGNDLAIAERKIIYEAEVKLVVEDFSQTETAIPQLVQQHGGYLANSTVDRTRGDRRSGRWIARIPVERYEAFLEAASQLGVPETINQTAQDVTEEYLDLEARIANKQRLEQRILELLKNPQGEIKDVIEVERELARVRGDIEQMEGRLKYLANRTALTTVTLVVREQRDYTPPQAPSFATRIGRSWENSLAMLRLFAENFTLVAVFAAPWLAILLIVAGPPAWYLRSRSKRQPAAPLFPETKNGPQTKGGPPNAE